MTGFATSVSASSEPLRLYALPFRISKNTERNQDTLTNRLRRHITTLLQRQRTYYCVQGLVQHRV